MYEKSLENQDGALNNTESLLLQLQEAQQQKIVSGALSKCSNYNLLKEISYSVIGNGHLNLASQIYNLSLSGARV